MNDQLVTELQTDLQSVIARLETLREAPAQVQPPAAPEPAPATVHPGFAAEGEFYDWLRDNDMLGPKITPSEFKGCDAITRACAAAEWPLSWTAYALGTAYLETAHQMLPVREAYWLSDSAANNYFRRMYDPQGSRPDVARRLGNSQPGDGIRFPGRGYPQLTGRANYAKASQKLGIDLVGRPERALEPEIAAQVMIHGMAEGWFTGKKLEDYLPRRGPAALEQFIPARHMINGTDRAADVAGFALNFQKGLAAGKWRFGES